MSRSPKQIEILQAESKDDVTKINSFFNKKSIKQELHRFTYRTTLDRAFERDDRRLYYIEKEDRVLGALMVWCESRVLDDEESQIRLVAVDPAHREEGIAKRLCETAEQFAGKYGMNKMSADVARDSPALGFWRQCGYSVEYEWETDGGREMARMEKQIYLSHVLFRSLKFGQYLTAVLTNPLSKLFTTRVHFIFIEVPEIGEWCEMISLKIDVERHNRVLPLNYIYR
jgi:GNAT superfamily N-acetyltransferase